MSSIIRTLLKKILVIRFSSIGDIVLTTPVVRCIRKQIPGVELHYLTRAPFAGILRNNPYIDKVWSVENDLPSVIEDLKNERFDFVADLHHNIRSLRVRTSLGVPNATFNKLNIEKWLMVNFKLNRLPETHIVSRYMQTVASLGVKYDASGLDFFIGVNDEVDLKSLPEPWSQGYIAFVIGAKHATKRLPPEKIIAIINEMKLPVVLLGGKEDQQTGDEIVSKTGKFTWNACGKFNLGQSASLVKQAFSVITHDTGLMHIAAAFQQRVISVWGNTIPEFGMTPFLIPGKGQSVIIENNNLTCRPCTKIGFEKCPKKHFKCMVEINIQSIVKQSLTWWNSR